MKLSLRTFFIIAAIACMSLQISADEQECAASDELGGGCEDPACPSRPHIIRCAGKYLDTNKNKKLERGELEKAISALPWYARSVLKVIGSIDKIMKKCDADGDGAIGMETDMPATEESCLASCFKRKAFKAAFFPECTE